ncbi:MULTISPECIES: PhzF family phenazine biosynthesis protein [Chitinophaga]|uniref:PhzF family phenazine biosynthesis protein n=1 Tax=Chitinophaga TaxID=79328 RepID=UPI000BB0536A|nr:MULTISPECIES: PhzF family phenazine biosynthesis protein [Chitinophaga]ASZ12989.1 isomerase [Chitinophaga sp. MD30]
MQLDIYQIDAFTDTLFGGNPACVVPLTEWLPDTQMLQIAAENAVAETAFFILQQESALLRWFTPDIEMDLCGHATLATAHVIKQHLGYTNDQISFHTLSGELIVTFENDTYRLDLPARMPSPAPLPDIIRDAISIQPVAVLKARDYVLVYNTETDVRNIRIDRQIFDQINLDPGGVIITAKGERSDFVSRFFTPQSTILEDPVTGSAHCSLIPYWASILNKQEMFALQVSSRLGKLYCTNKGQRVNISGKARTYLKGACWIV